MCIILWEHEDSNDPTLIAASITGGTKGAMAVSKYCLGHWRINGRRIDPRLIDDS